MKRSGNNADKELYQQLRTLTPEQLWNEDVPRFNRATPEERLKNVSLVRAVGVVFSESGTEEQRKSVRPWLRALLQDPAEKIRRYAMTALPKLGAGAQDEVELLSLLQKTNVEREKKFLGQTLNKIGGSATLAAVQASGAVALGTVQKLKANVARAETPSRIRMDRVLFDLAGLKIHLRGRTGLEEIVAQEARERGSGKFRVEGISPGLVVISPTAPFSLDDLYAFRCFGTAGFVLGEARDESTAAFAAAIASPQTRHILETFTEGPLRYRLEFVAKGHQRGAVRNIVEQAYAKEPRILNDARSAPWAIDVHPAEGKQSIELRPRLTPDPRLWFRQQDVPAASHPPLAACMARLGRQKHDDLIWDPFCGSGLELIECGFLGGAGKVCGTDINEDAIAISKKNFVAAGIAGTEARFIRCDFRDARSAAGLAKESVSLIITNPPLGMRIPVPNLRGLIADLFATAAAMLKPGGRLVLANPVRVEPVQRTLLLQSRRAVDFGGFECQVEVYAKVAEPPPARAPLVTRRNQPRQSHGPG